jgi:hypothetical protein
MCAANSYLSILPGARVPEKDHRYGFGSELCRKELRQGLLPSPDRSDIYGSDAGARHRYPNPGRDPFGPNPNCGYKNC